MRAVAPIVRADDQGDRRWFYGGGTHTWKVTAEESGGGFLLFEDSLTRGKMTPLHRHPDADETMFVVGGEILVNIDGTEHRVGTGGVTFSPRGVAHAFSVQSDAARLLFLQTPGSAQPFYWSASTPVVGDGPAPVDFARVSAAAHQHGGTELLGPPPFSPS